MILEHRKGTLRKILFPEGSSFKVALFQKSKTLIIISFDYLAEAREYYNTLKLENI